MTEPESNNPSNGTSNGSTKNGILSASKLPEIPHISSNILPLSNILKFHTQEAYKQLTTIIENLSVTHESENDSSRKKKFLQLIISLRQDFIKLYTLVKWAANSKDVSKFIDLLNWFRIQEFQFEQLSFQLNALNSFSGAKLPNSDLITALQVFFKGRPQLPSYNFIKVPKISSEKTLEVLKDLNLILITRMALTDIPERFINNYVIQDGRIFFSVPDEFQISITVANDLIIDEESEYHKSPFYFVDFKFLFGINPETSLITYKDNKIITKLPKSSHEKLEKIVNSVLLNQGLNGLYDLLHKYSISFKLYLISKQLKELVVNTKWRNCIQFNYQNGKSLIIINYWSGHYLSRNWKSFIEIGIDRSYTLNFRWFKNGRYFLNHGITEIFNKVEGEEDDDANESQDLSIDFIINIIVNKHSELLMKKIYEEFEMKLNEQMVETQAPQMSFLTPHQLLIKLSPNKSTIFAINPTNGFFYFIDPTPIQNQITKKINQPVNTKKSFITEQDMIENIVENLIQLRLETFTNEIYIKLLTTEWINNDLTKLNDFEIAKLLVNYEFKYSPTISKIQFYRRKTWPSSWFLISLIGGITSYSNWWVSRIKSVNGEWKIQWIEEMKWEDDHPTEKLNSLQLSENSKPSEAVQPSKTSIRTRVDPSFLNYDFFNNLSTLCSNMIIDHMILEELKLRNIKFIKVDAVEEMLKKFKITLNEESIDVKNDDTKSKPIIYESVLMLYNQNLLPVYNSSTSLFLKIKLINLNNDTQMRLKLFGNLRNVEIKDSTSFSSLNLKVTETNGFEIEDLINFSTKLNGEEEKESNQMLDNIFKSLSKLSKLIKVLDQLKKFKVEVLNNSINDILINIHKNFGHLVIDLPDRITDESENEGSSALQLHTNLSDNDINLILQNLNKYLTNHPLHSIEAISTIISYLNEINPILKSIQQIKKNFNQPENQYRLQNGLTKLNFDIKLPTLNMIQLIFNFNYQTNSSKKISKDRIMINLTFKRNKFDSTNRNLIKLSLKDNLNLKNMKYKKLFELIFKAINTFDLEQQKKSKTEGLEDSCLIKLNYDFLVSPTLIEDLLVRVANCFLLYLQGEKS
jgi:mediator of RNA polymerase II transcription subunit 14